VTSAVRSRQHQCLCVYRLPVLGLNETNKPWSQGEMVENRNNKQSQKSLDTDAKGLNCMRSRQKERERLSERKR